MKESVARTYLLDDFEDVLFENVEQKTYSHYDSGAVSADSAKRTNAFSKLDRALAEEDMQSKGTQRLLLNELDKYEECKRELESYQTRYHEKDKRCAVLEEKVNQNTAFEIICSIALSIGALLIGMVDNEYPDWKLIIGGTILLGGAIFAKIAKYNKK
ncbi:MAG: hypothetical protein K2L04_05615 [Alistipes sp.]|nr:hypothetical protein [Alistipes sp.]